MNVPSSSHHKEIFKNGLIVADIHQAMADLGAWLDLQWTPVRTVGLTLKTAAGLETVELSFACSTRGETTLELLQARDHGYYRLRPGEALHHLSIWVDDLAQSSRLLAEQGMPLEAAGVVDGLSPALFAFHTNPHGLRVELVDAAMRPGFLQWLGGGELPL